MPEQSDATWFAHANAEFLIFRVNRRPLDDGDALWQRQLPPDVYEHFARMLAPGHEVVTGHRFQRIWRIGGVKRDPNQRTVVGKLGWVPRGEAVVPQWSAERKDWLSSTATPRGGKILPFGFDGESRLLTVMADRQSTKPILMASVFERVLRENEAELPGDERSTEWSVEPILDAEEFVAWLRELDVVTSVSFTAKLPNPDPTDAFSDLAGRMKSRRATEYTESMVSKREEGLIGITEDRDFRQAIVMGEHGFAKLRGRGLRDGHKTSYKQTKAVATEHVDDLPPTWDEVWSLLKEMLKGPLRRFLDDGSA